ncbi:MAG: LptF/LptG family permease [Treponema sp.]|jgi:lipopolysaccharide export system permease protein|nr:LptF/LptG family permease [Treponema sp.]
MSVLDRYVIKQFLPVFAASLAMFMTLIILIDLFVYLFRFLDNGAAIWDILKVSACYIPKSFIFALPVALLFTSSYTLGDLYTKNELSTVLCSGIPFWRFCVPLFILGISASLFSFFFENHVVIPAFKVKNALSKTLLRSVNEENTSDVVIRSGDGRIIYAADFFDILKETLYGVQIIELDGEYAFQSFTRASSAAWNGDHWVLSDPVLYEWEGGFIKPRRAEINDRYKEEPETFRRSLVVPAELKVGEAKLHVENLKKSGLSYAEAEADYFHRFSFPAVSFVVIFLSVTMGGRFKKNTLLMSLLASLGTAVIFYVIEMLSMMSAKAGILPAPAGAWIPVFMCLIAGFFLLRYAKT